MEPARDESPVTIKLGEDDKGTDVPRWMVERVPMLAEMLGVIPQDGPCVIPIVLPELDAWGLQRTLEWVHRAADVEPMKRDPEDLDTCDDWERQWIERWPAPDVAPTYLPRRLLSMIRVSEFLNLADMRVALRTVQRERLDSFYDDYDAKHPERPAGLTGDALRTHREDWIYNRLVALYEYCGTMDEKEEGPFAFHEGQKAELLAMYDAEQDSWQ